MRIFLTGGTGFIGSHFINLAHAAGIEIIAHRRSEQSRTRIAMDREPSWVDGAYGELPEASFAQCEVLVHLAAHSTNSPYDTLENCIAQNVIEPLKLFRKAKAAGIRRFIIAGSCFEYGNSGERYDFIPPTAPLEPTQSYPASKAAASIAFSAFAREENVEMLILRVFHVYGEGELESRFWPSLKAAALAGRDFPMSLGLQIRDFVPVTFVAKEFLRSLERNDLVSAAPLIENLGTGEPRSLREFAEREWRSFNPVGKLLTGTVQMRSGEVMRYVPQITKI